VHLERAYSASKPEQRRLQPLGHGNGCAARRWGGAAGRAREKPLSIATPAPQNPCKPHANPMQTPCKPRANPVQTPCKLHANPSMQTHANPMQTPCKPRANPVQTPCKPHANPVQTPCKPHANPPSPKRFTFEASPFCSYAADGAGVHIVFAGEVGAWPGVNAVNAAHDGARAAPASGSDRV
jgi:hypothetical protein